MELRMSISSDSVWFRAFSILSNYLVMGLCRAIKRHLISYITQHVRQHISKRPWDACDVERVCLHPKCKPLTIDRVRWWLTNTTSTQGTCCMLAVVSSCSWGSKKTSDLRGKRKKVESSMLHGWWRALEKGTRYLHESSDTTVVFQKAALLH